MFVYCDNNRAKLLPTNDSEDKRIIFSFMDNDDDDKWILLIFNTSKIFLFLFLLFVDLFVFVDPGKEEPASNLFWNSAARKTQTWYFYLLCVLNIGVTSLAFWWGCWTVSLPPAGEKEDSRENLLKCIRKSLDAYISIGTLSDAHTAEVAPPPQPWDLRTFERECNKRFAYQQFTLYLANPASSFSVLSNCGGYSRFNTWLSIFIYHALSLTAFQAVYWIINFKSLWAVLCWVGWLVCIGILIWAHVSLQTRAGWHRKLAGIAREIRRGCLTDGYFNFEDLEKGGDRSQDRKKAAKERLEKWMWDILKDDTDSELKAIKRRMQELVPLIEKIVL